MSYSITRHADDLLWVEVHGHMDTGQAEAYYGEVWQTLDGCPRPTHMLLDGRGLHSASHSARRRTEEVAHHPHLGHVAFVIREQHLMIFGPFMRLVSGISLFGSEAEALDYLQAARGLPPISPEELHRARAAHPHVEIHADAVSQPRGNASLLGRLTGMVNGWSRSLDQWSDDERR
ncbi:MAG: hypothetical protein MUD01_02120 [Chloroflexaceae bacterium]|jgi:hypothetical protein|nr:hypothetical protein [Chloroflexaceae bacterium]